MELFEKPGFFTKTWTNTKSLKGETRFL